MQAFRCSKCDQLLFFENSVCLGCGSNLGFSPRDLRLDVIAPDRRRCANVDVAGCNWLVEAGDPVNLCRSCRLTRTRPNNDDVQAMAAFVIAERAKRQLLFQILSLRLEFVDRETDPAGGLAFDLLSSRNQEVMTGHEDGVITFDLSESDAVHREFVRLQLGEPYRTVLGHLRHEIGHYFWPQLVDATHLGEFRRLFGDETLSYEAALQQHYDGGPPLDWPNTYVSAYATMHPWEDWAETFAHYLHIDAGLETASQFGMSTGEPSATAARRAMGDADANRTAGAIDDMIEQWLGLTVALNAMSHALGQGALYPFVLSPKVVDKLDFVHRCIRGAGARPPAN